MSNPVISNPPAGGPPTPNFIAVLRQMLTASDKVSDLIFSPGRPPIVEQDGRLLAVRVQGLPVLTADHTQRIAADLIGHSTAMTLPVKPPVRVIGSGLRYLP